MYRPFEGDAQTHARLKVFETLLALAPSRAAILAICAQWGVDVPREADPTTTAMVRR